MEKIEPRTVIGKGKCAFCKGTVDLFVGAQKGNRAIYHCHNKLSDGRACGSRGTAGVNADHLQRKNYLNNLKETLKNDKEETTATAPEASPQEESTSDGTGEPAGNLNDGTGTEPEPVRRRGIFGI